MLFAQCPAAQGPFIPIGSNESGRRTSEMEESYDEKDEANKDPEVIRVAPAWVTEYMRGEVSYDPICGDIIGRDDWIIRSRVHGRSIGGGRSKKRVRYFGYLS